MNTTETHTQFIAHLNTLDKAWLAGLRASGFVKRHNQMVCPRTDVRATRLGFGNGYLLRWFPGMGGEVVGNVHAETIEDTEAAIREVVAYRDRVAANG